MLVTGKTVGIKQIVYYSQELKAGGKVNSFTNEYIIIRYDKCCEGKEHRFLLSSCQHQDDAARPLWKESHGPGLKDTWGLLHPCQHCSGDMGNLARAAVSLRSAECRGSALF